VRYGQGMDTTKRNSGGCSRPSLRPSGPARIRWEILEALPLGALRSSRRSKLGLEPTTRTDGWAHDGRRCDISVKALVPSPLAPPTRPPPVLPAPFPTSLPEANGIRGGPAPS
jgi:hypothetical protein